MTKAIVAVVIIGVLFVFGEKNAGARAASLHSQQTGGAFATPETILFQPHTPRSGGPRASSRTAPVLDVTRFTNTSTIDPKSIVPPLLRVRIDERTCSKQPPVQRDVTRTLTQDYNAVIDNARWDFIFFCRGRDSNKDKAQLPLVRVLNDVGLRSGQRFNQIPTLINVLSFKGPTCRLSQKIFDRKGFWVSPPCVVSGQRNLTGVREAPSALWVTKPNDRSSGSGVVIVTSSTLLQRVDTIDVAQRYVHKPFLVYTGKHWIKTDIRVYGTIMYDPVRLFLSEYGYFRTGRPDRSFCITAACLSDRAMHISNNGYKMKKGLFVYPTDPDERNFASIGSLKKYKTLMGDGLYSTMWRNLKRKLLAFVVAAEEYVSCGALNPKWKVPCGTTSSQFNADVAVDKDGNTFILEIHTNQAFKSPGFSDVEATNKVIIPHTRAGALSSLLMQIALWLQPRGKIRTSLTADGEKLSLAEMLSQSAMAPCLGMEMILPTKERSPRSRRIVSEYKRLRDQFRDPSCPVYAPWKTNPKKFFG